jgi:hypothetical protein
MIDKCEKCGKRLYFWNDFYPDFCKECFVEQGVELIKKGVRAYIKAIGIDGDKNEN